MGEKINLSELQSFLDEKVEAYNQPFFIKYDPIQIPHRFQQLQDIEIMAFLMATLAWGNRKMIIKSGGKLLQLMGNSPYDFVMNYSEKEKLDFVHRTFNSEDLQFFLSALKNLYQKHDSLENLFLIKKSEENPHYAIERFRTAFFDGKIHRSSKHVSSPSKNSASKRLNMMLRWLARSDKQGVDFGIWQRVPMSKLSCPLDIHSGRVARKLGLLQRKQNDWKAVLELDESLRKLDPKDPIKYDFALFGLGAFESF